MGAVFTQAVATARWERVPAWLRAGPGQLVGTSLKATSDYLEAEYAAALLPADRQRAAGPARGL